MTSPTGYPPWSRTATAAIYGGHANLRNYGDIGAVNANTDASAEQYKRLSADLAACSLTAPMVEMVIEHTGGVWYVNYVKPMWAPAVTTQYVGSNPPTSDYPTVAGASSTSCNVILPTAPDDEFGVTYLVTVHMATPCFPGSFWIPNVSPAIFGIGGLPDDPDTICSVLVF